MRTSFTRHQVATIVFDTLCRTTSFHRTTAQTTQEFNFVVGHKSTKFAKFSTRENNFR